MSSDSRIKDKLQNHAKNYSLDKDGLKSALKLGEFKQSIPFDEITMPYGKHKGTAIGDLPTSYLRWLAENFDDERICAAADTELQYREEWNIK